MNKFKVFGSDVLAILSRRPCRNGTLRTCKPLICSPFYSPQTSQVHNCRLLSTSIVAYRSLDPLQSELGYNSENHDPNLSVLPFVDPKLSYAYGRSFKELKYCTLAPMIETITKREPHSTAVVIFDEGIKKNFEQFNSDINKIVNGLVEKFDLKCGDRVGLYSYNTYQYLLVQFACHKLGLVLNPFNPSYKAHEFSYVLKKSDIKILFMPGQNSKQSNLNDHWSVICDKSLADLQSKGEIKYLDNIILLDGDLEVSDLKVKNVKVNRWRNLFSDQSNELSGEARSRCDQVCPDDLYGVYYTSGTTGYPKGASITQFNTINNVTLTGERLFNQRGPIYERIRPNVCLPLPLFHEFAGVLGVLLPFIGGGSMVFPGMRYGIKSVVESIMRFKCNSIFLTPTILIDILGYVEKNNITQVPLRCILIAGSPVVSELVYKTKKILPDLEDFRIGYGSSENGVIATVQTSQEPSETQPFTVGPPLDFTEIRIVDPNTGVTTEIGQSGEVQTRGFNTMAGYYNDTKKTNEVLTSSRWYRTGDLGIIDKFGRLQIVGRIKDLIIKGGENIYPAEVETVLHGHPAIEDAHVFGIPDKRFGEEVCTWIKLKTDVDSTNDEDKLKAEILTYCKEKLTYFKVPKHVMFVKEFPTTPVKKVKKFVMRDETVKLLNL